MNKSTATAPLIKAPVDDDIKLWDTIVKEVENEGVFYRYDKDFVKEVVKRFTERGGIDKSVNIETPPKELDNAIVGV